jgi:uncharacterized 2Fe-2S/4Fe-4S cluster protein (DUF4445 family)
MGDSLDEMVQRLAKYLHRVMPMVDTEDIAQEMYLWAVVHWTKVDAFRAEGADGEEKLRKALRRAGSKFAQAERRRHWELSRLRDE